MRKNNADINLSNMQINHKLKGKNSNYNNTRKIYLN